MTEGETRVVGGDVVAEAAVEEGIATIDRVRSLEGRAEAGMPTHFSIGHFSFTKELPWSDTFSST